METTAPEISSLFYISTGNEESKRLAWLRFEVCSECVVKLTFRSVDVIRMRYYLCH